MSWRPRVVDVLRRMGAAMRGRGDETRARAYLRAAAALERRKDFDEILERGRLREVAGVGASIERSVLEFVRTGEAPAWAAPAGASGEPESVEPDEAWRSAPLPRAVDLHVHTMWSDGALTVEEVAAAAERLGASAIGVSDHSAGLRVARGLDADEVRAQWAEIDAVQARHPGVRLLKGTECDILRDGSLDHPREILAGFDHVIGSLHSHLRLPREEQTARVLAALDDPYLTALGHPTTRLVRRRPPADLDLDAVFAKAAARGVAVEVNGNPRRLDLNAALARKALRAGCRLSLGSDAHSAQELLAFAEARRIAERAGARESDILDARELPRRLATASRAADRQAA